MIFAENFKKRLRNIYSTVEAIDFCVCVMYYINLLKLSEMITGRNEILSVPALYRETKVEAREYFQENVLFLVFFCLKAAKNARCYSNLIYVT